MMVCFAANVCELACWIVAVVLGSVPGSASSSFHTEHGSKGQRTLATMTLPGFRV